ncbi:MAG: L-rhamnose mutarotase, partial [Ruminococcaceae bacterium]|nr:L-rhamnose mutarotase [Oscillospiraceae bacterium]
DGKREEYCRRHDQIWESMKQVLKSAGICNYSIWIVDNDIFGYVPPLTLDGLTGVMYSIISQPLIVLKVPR